MEKLKNISSQKNTWVGLMKKFLDAHSMRILRELYKNSKITYKELAEKVGITTTACYRRVRELEDRGIIKAYTIEVDAKKLGFPIKVLIEVKTRTGVSTEIVKVLGTHPNILKIYGVTGEQDAVIEAYFQSIEEMDSFLKECRETCSDIKDTITHIILNEHKNPEGWFQIVNR